MFCIDASVLLNAFLQEPGSERSRRFLDRLKESGERFIVPELLFPEIAGALGRGTKNAILAERYVATLRTLPGLISITLDASLADVAATIAATQRLKGGDAVYVATAQAFGATLITLDEEQYARARIIISAQKP
ncbi:type II toxin-antitoxin system VapC family toxin [Candidatus Uhrbacteria bacterium]|nr:type II toxin-antitoxin system VapC family toxin [Candidatus Uhrbacteria bacterium]